MKIVCGSCQAKYSIADEKVAGKVFKIRCKRCSEVIVVRGDQGEADAAPSVAAEEASADAIWHIVINGEQAGPYSAAQLSEMLSSGKLDWEAYVWAEGFENWLPMRDIPDLVSAISGPSQREPEPVRAVAPVYAAAGNGTYGAQPGYAVQPSMGADPFADDSATTASVFGSSAAMGQSAGRSNLFAGNATESPFEAAESRVVASAPSPRVSVEQAMTGARNENSVLFSLKNLQALATGSSAPAAPSGSLNRAGFATGEGSGLIDIRALATATGVNDQGRAASEKDALLSLGSAQTGAFGALGSPMLSPGRSDDDSNKKGLVLAIMGGFALLAVAGIAAAVILKPQPSVSPANVAPAVPPPLAASANPTTQPAAAVSAEPAEAPSEGEQAAERERLAREQRGPSPAQAASAESAHRAQAAKRGGDRSAVEPAPSAKAEPAAPKVEDKPKPKAGASSIDDLLDSAIGSKGGKAAAAAEPAANLPEKPSRDDVLAAMNGVKGAVSTCAKGQTGVAFANITVSGKSGRVSNVEVTGMTGEAGSCIARTVRTAKFPKFKSESFQIKFPFRI